MPIELDALPPKLPLPRAPRQGRWCLTLVLCSLLVGVVVLWFWPDDGWPVSLWFWSCALVFPVTAALALFGMRLVAYERQRDYAISWNIARGQQEQALVQRGQRGIAIVAASYRCAVGNKNIAKALSGGVIALQPAMRTGAHVLLSVLDEASTAANPSPTEAQYRERLASHLDQILTGLDADLQDHAPDQPLQVRIRHNQVLDDDAILSLWRACRGDRPADRVVFANGDDGLMWLDAWLDEAQPCARLLSVEINVPLEPVAEQAESISAVLLAPADECAERAIAIQASVHRPVRMTNLSASLDLALRWGQVAKASNEYRVWLSQLPPDFPGELKIAMCASGGSPAADRWNRLDSTLGLPACAVGNMALIIASEQARAEGVAQLLILQDSSVQTCVVQPV